MTVLVLFDFWKKVRKFILSPITDPNLELVIVMFVVPFIVNALIFWVVDNFLKEKPQTSHKIAHIDGESAFLENANDDDDLADSAASTAAGKKHVRLSPFSRTTRGYGRVHSRNDSDSERLLSFDEDPGFDAELARSTWARAV